MHALIKQRNHELFESFCFCWINWFRQHVPFVILLGFEEYNSEHDLVDGGDERVDVIPDVLLVLAPLLEGRVALGDHVSFDVAVHEACGAEVD